LAGAIEEVDESALWLEILVEAGICGRSQTAPLWREADELTRILVRSHKQPKHDRQSRIDHQQPIANQDSRIIN
jgi:hypothetical protein